MPRAWAQVPGRQPAAAQVAASALPVAAVAPASVAVVVAVARPAAVPA